MPIPAKLNSVGGVPKGGEVPKSVALEFTKIRGNLGLKQKKWKRRARLVMVENTHMKEIQSSMKRAEEGDLNQSANKRRREVSLPPVETPFNSKSAELFEQLCRKQ